MHTLNQYSSVSLGRRGPRRAAGRVPFSATALALVLLIAPALATTAQAATEPVTVEVSSSQKWTNTNILVKTGDSISVTASGIVHFGPPPITRITPDGLPSSRCAELIQRAGKARPFAAPGLDCWSLIGMIAPGKPFPVGASATFKAASDGELLLGVNDNQLTDNSGSFTGKVTVTPARGAATPGTGKSSGGSTILFVVAALVVLGLLAFFLVARRRRSGDEPPEAPAEVIIPDEQPNPFFAPPIVNGRVDEPVASPAEQPVEQPVGSRARAAAPIGTSVAPLEGEIVDVNIFEVEISNGTDLRVGYNYFPEGTELHWQVRQGNIFANGEFSTNGGGNMYHYVTLPLGVKLVPAPAAADVQFSWSIGGVPFRYSVRRDPGL